MNIKKCLWTVHFLMSGLFVFHARAQLYIQLVLLNDLMYVYVKYTIYCCCCYSCRWWVFLFVGVAFVSIFCFRCLACIFIRFIFTLCRNLVCDDGKLLITCSTYSNSVLFLLSFTSTFFFSIFFNIFFCRCFALSVSIIIIMFHWEFLLRFT